MTETGTTAVIEARGQDHAAWAFGGAEPTGKPPHGGAGLGRVPTFVIASIAYLAAALAGAIVFEMVEAFGAQDYRFQPDRLANTVIIIASLTLIPFLLVKGCMSDSGWDGFWAHVMGAAVCSAIIGLLLGAVFGAPMLKWSVVSPFLGGLGFWGAIAGAAYWSMRAVLRRIWQGFAL